MKVFESPGGMIQIPSSFFVNTFIKLHLEYIEDYSNEDCPPFET